MKTNTQRLISFFTVLCAVFATSAEATNAAAVEKLSSGIQVQYYSLEWCSPHYQRITGFSTACKTGFFQLDS